MTRLELLKKELSWLFDHRKFYAECHIAPLYSLCMDISEVIENEYWGSKVFSNIMCNFEILHISIPAFIPPKKKFCSFVNRFPFVLPEHKTMAKDAWKNREMLMQVEPFLEFVHSEFWWPTYDFKSRYMYLLRLIKYYKNHPEENIDLDTIFLKD